MKILQEFEPSTTGQTWRRFLVETEPHTTAARPHKYYLTVFENGLKYYQSAEPIPDPWPAADPAPKPRPKAKRRQDPKKKKRRRQLANRSKRINRK